MIATASPGTGHRVLVAGDSTATECSGCTSPTATPAEVDGNSIYAIYDEFANCPGLDMMEELYALLKFSRHTDWGGFSIREIRKEQRRYRPVKSCGRPLPCHGRHRIRG